MRTTPLAGVGSLPQRLATFYFFYYATVGAFQPYWSPYLEARGFSPTQMGVVYALMGVMRIIVPFIWGWYADQRGERITLIRQASVGALLLFLLIPFTPDVFWLGVFMVGYTLLWHALLPQFEVVAWNHLLRINGDYPRVRLWGSVGYIVAVLGLGVVLDLTGILWLPWLVGAFWVGMALTAWTVPDAEIVKTSAGEAVPSLLAVLKNPGVLALLFVCFCSQLSYAPYYNFFSLFLERHDVPRTHTGFLWAIAVVAEVVFFLYAARLIERHGARAILQLAMLATVLRWALTPLAVDVLPLLVILQMGHALSFGAYHAVAMQYVQQMFPGALQGRGQAIYNAASYGIGGSVGSLASGWLFDHWSPEGTFYLAALAALLGAWVCWRKVPALR